MSADSLSSRKSAQVSTQSAVSARKLLWAGPLAIAAAIAANLLARAVLFALLDLPAGFPPLQPGAIAIFTAIGLLAATLVYAIVIRVARRPVRTFTWIALVALVLSILPNLGLMANPAAAPFPGGTAQAFGVLVVFHIVAAVVGVYLLIRLSQEG